MTSVHKMISSNRKGTLSTVKLALAEFYLAIEIYSVYFIINFIWHDKT